MREFVWYFYDLEEEERKKKHNWIISTNFPTTELAKYAAEMLQHTIGERRSISSLFVWKEMCVFFNGAKALNL